MYQKYQTDALVLKSRESGEADRSIYLYTRDFGLVNSRCRAVRTEKSKMRYALQNYSRARVGLIRGRQNWRIAGAIALESSHGRDANATAAFARIAELVTRLVAGEEANAYLFEVLSEAHGSLMQENCSAWATIELVCVARVLYSLGYISAEALQTALFTHTSYADTHLKEAEELRNELLLSINQAISETHL